MSDDRLIKFEINIVDGGSPVDQENLMGCYFEASDSNDTFQFFGAGGHYISTIPEFITVGTPGFQFIRAGMLWTVSELHIDLVNSVMKGRWDNPRRPMAGDDDGHFQAHAGGGGGTVEESAASAGA